MAKIIAEEGSLKGLVLDLHGGNEWILGCDPDESQLVLSDPSVSKKHILLRSTPEGMILENITQESPVFINDEETHGPHMLHHGDSVKIGEGYYRFYSEETAQIEDLELPVQPTKEEHDTIIGEDEHHSETMLAEIDLNLTDSSPWLLKVVSGPNAGAQFSMFPDTSYVVGTDPATCDIVFHDVSVSRQHARLYVDRDNTLSVEDLQSSNGTVVDGKKVEGRANFAPNTLITTGTTSFTVYDREGERRTVISPLLPAIVKILQQQEPGEKSQEVAKAPSQTEVTAPPPVDRKSEQMRTIGSFLFIVILCGLLVVIGIATAFLFKTEEVKPVTFDTAKILEQELKSYSGIRYTFNTNTGRLSLVGHVLTTIDRNQLLHDLRSLPFVKDVVDNVVVDEKIWSETNNVLANNPAWKGVTVHSPAPGRFVITGYIDTKKEADELSEYLSHNFDYIDLLEQKIIVDEDVINQATVYLKEEGFSGVTARFDNGVITLSGNVPFGEKGTLKTITDKIKKIPGVRDVKTLLTETAPVSTLVDLTGQYVVKGSLQQPNGQISVLINDKVLSIGDLLDGKIITKIEPNVIMLESGGIKYRIDYNR